MKITFRQSGYSVLIFSLALFSCGKNSKPTEDVKSTNENTKSTLNAESNSSEAKPIDEATNVIIEGVYSGTDNVGMESTIMLRPGGRMIVQPSVGDGTPSRGRWSGTSDNLSLYIETEQPFYDSYGQLRMGGDQLLGNAKITESGLQIIGGNFYSRQ